MAERPLGFNPNPWWLIHDLEWEREEMDYDADDDKCTGCGSDPCTNSTPNC